MESDGSFCVWFFSSLAVETRFLIAWPGSFFLRLERCIRDCGVSMSNCEFLVCMMV